MRDASPATCHSRAVAGHPAAAHRRITHILLPNLQARPALLPKTGKLHRADERFSTVPGFNVLLEVPLHPWPSLGGGSGGEWGSSSRNALTIELAPDAVKLRESTFSPPNESEFGALRYSGGRLMLVAGVSAYSFWPGTATLQTLLRFPVPSGLWRLASVRGKLYCVQAGQVEVIDVPTWTSQLVCGSVCRADVH